MPSSLSRFLLAFVVGVSPDTYDNNDDDDDDGVYVFHGHAVVAG